jgi:hypothetical protein
MATSIPQDFALLQKRRVRARVLSLSFVATIILSIVVGPSWLYTVKLGPFDAPIIGVIGFLSFPLSVFFFGVALKYVKLQQHLRTPVDLQMSREKLDKALRASRVRLLVWILIFLSPFYAVIILTAAHSSSLSLLVSTLLVAGLLCVSGFFASVLEFNNNRALSTMLDWSPVEPISETEAPNL